MKRHAVRDTHKRKRERPAGRAVKTVCLEKTRREVGIVKWYDPDTGCGYIARKQGEDIYVHYSAILCEYGDCILHSGDAVEFTVVEADSGPQAQEVVIIN